MKTEEETRRYMEFLKEFRAYILEAGGTLLESDGVVALDRDIKMLQWVLND